MSLSASIPVTDTPMVGAQHSAEDTDADVIMGSAIVDSADADAALSECQDALKLAQEDALQTANALENLLEGIQAVKRILERPFDETESNSNSHSSNIGTGTHRSDDTEIVSSLSEKLVGVLGSELIGLLNAAQMTKSHALLRAQDHDGVLNDLHRAKEVTQKANDRANRAERTGRRLKKEKKLLVREVRTLREDRLVLVREVKSLRKMAKRSKQSEALRILRDAVQVHESVLCHKTFTSGFGGVDPPGAVTENTEMPDTPDTIQSNSNSNCNSDSEAHKEFDVAQLSPSSNKENNGQYTYIPRTEKPDSKPVDNIVFGVYTSAKHSSKSPATSVLSATKQTPKLAPAKDCGNKPAAPVPVAKTPSKISLPSKPTSRSPLKPTFKSVTSPSLTKKSPLGFSKGFGNSLSNGLGRFKNVLQEASDQMLHPEMHHHQNNQNQQKLIQQTKRGSPSEKHQTDCSNHYSHANSHNTSITSATSENNCKHVDDATKSTQSCSFNSSEINSSLNLTASAIGSEDEDTPDDLAFQISIDEGSSFLNSSHIRHEDSPSSRMVITPETSPISGQPADKDSNPTLHENALRTLAMPSLVRPLP
eukprot:jgi/Psemu1/29464/gm1.29464_g